MMIPLPRWVLCIDTHKAKSSPFLCFVLIIVAKDTIIDVAFVSIIPLSAMMLL